MPDRHSVVCIRCTKIVRLRGKATIFLLDLVRLEVKGAMNLSRLWLILATALELYALVRPLFPLRDPLEASSTPAERIAAPLTLEDEDVRQQISTLIRT